MKGYISSRGKNIDEQTEKTVSDFMVRKPDSLIRKFST
jgi:hypothetical protein